MKKKTAVLLLSIIIFTVISIVSIAHFFYTTFRIIELDMHATLGDRMGFNIDTDKIWFGIVKGHATSTRRLHLTNDLDQKILIKMTPSGDITPYLTMNMWQVILQPKEEKEVGISVRFPPGTPEGNYTGTLKVVFKKSVF